MLKRTPRVRRPRVGKREPRERLALQTPHPPRARRNVVVVSEKMQNTVDNQMRQLFAGRRVKLSGGFAKFFVRKREVADENSGVAVVFEVAGGGGGEGEDVGAEIGVSEFAVEGAQSLSAREHDGERDIRRRGGGVQGGEGGAADMPAGRGVCDFVPRRRRDDEFKFKSAFHFLILDDDEGDGEGDNEGAAVFVAVVVGDDDNEGAAVVVSVFVNDDDDGDNEGAAVFVPVVVPCDDDDGDDEGAVIVSVVVVPRVPRDGAATL